jgi:hypothetical protein
MKTYTIQSIVAIAVVALFTGCNTVDPVEQDLTDQEIEMTGEIVAESLSGERSGLMATFYDAFSNISRDGISYDRNSHADDELLSDNIANRSSESEWSAEYDPETGEHTISFRRSFEGPIVSKSLSVLNKYIFTDTEGEFLEFPRRDQNLIETIDFKGSKSGSVESVRKSSSFSRIDTLFTSGLHSESPVLRLEGSHDGEGEMTVQLQQANRTVERSYQIRLNLIDVQIDKEVVTSKGTLEEGVSGLITYSIEMNGTSNGQSREKTISGTIEMTGDGSALLRFDRIEKVLRLGLRSGEVSL